MAQQFAPAVRIVNPIDENHLVTLKGNTHPAANAGNDRGPVSPDLPMTDLILVLSRSPEQQAAFDKFVASQYEPGSPDFHHWLEPEEVGANFGPSESDIATISKWLTGHGFSIDEVSKDRMTIRFSGTAGQVESTFHTEIHNLEVKGAAHIGNMSDPQIPSALTPVVVGVKALHNFFPKPMHKLGSKVQFNSKTGRWERVASTSGADAATSAASTAASGAGGRLSPRPQFGTQDSYGDVIEDVAPYDFATIYNVLPLWNAANRIDGTGQTIAIVGTSDILPADITTFRSAFGLPAVKSFTTIVANGTDPGQCGVNPTSTCSLGDQIENSLDVEWSGAVAPGADQVLVVSGSNSTTTDTVYSSANYIIQNKATLNASILNVSYGACELGMGTSGNVAYYDMWQTAAAEGIAAFLASGDSGSASCDQGGDNGGQNLPYVAELGLSVSGLASSPYDTAVGGTDFNWCPASDITSNTACKASPYWSASNNATTQANALGYVPEIPWNDSCASATGIAVAQYLAGGLNGDGYSTPTPSDAETSCNFYVLNYFLVYELTGYDFSGFVDTVGGSGGKSGCVVNSTTSTATGPVSSCVSTTTSTGTANGSIPLVNDGWPKPSWQTNANIPGLPSDGVRDIPDVSFFAANGFNESAYLICVSVNGSCTYSATSENTAQEVGGTSVSSPAMAGVMALINQKTGVAQGNPNSELYALAAQQTYSSCSAESVTASSACYFNDIDEYTNDQPCDYLNLSPNCVASESYEGGADEVGLLSSGSATEGGYNATRGYDMATGLGSLNVANVVNGWTSLMGTAAASVTVTPASSSLQVNTALSVTVTVGSVPAGGTTPTGTVALSGGGLSPTLVGTLSSGSYTFTIPAFSLSGGTDTLTATYSGDSTYAQESGTASVTVTMLTPTVTVQPYPTTVGTNTIVVVGVTVTGTGPTPTGTVQLTGGGYTSGACTLASGACTINIPANSLSNGTDTLSVAYSGDSNYNAASGTATVTVNILWPTVTVTPAANSVESGSSLTVTGTVSGTGPTPTGTVQLTGGSYLSAAVTLSSGSYSVTIPANSLSAGSDTLTVYYSGDINYATGTGTASVTVTQSIYALAATTPAAIAPGGTATSTVTVSSSTGYSGTVTLSCALTTYPSGATDLPITCSGVNTTQSVGGTGATFTVYTTAASSELVWPKLGNGKGWAGAGGGAVLAFLMFLGIPARRRSWRSMLGMMALVAVLGSMAACGGGGGGNSGTTAGSYTFTVTGSGIPPVTPAPTATFTVTVN
ncbi:MAG: protease pro-enzyme activation domain-containing protein [Bryobacteraceae bacterium]